MNNEIKELIEDMQRFDNKWRNVDTKLAVATYPINQEQMPILLDCITNLQEKVNQYENPDDLTLFYMWLDEKAKDKIKKLQEENDKFYDETMKDIKDNLIARINRQEKEIAELKAKLEMYENGVYFSSENDELQERIDKAIEYIGINEEILETCEIYDVNGIEVYKILQGRDKE